jgi:WD40 repeat protein
MSFDNFPNQKIKLKDISINVNLVQTSNDIIKYITCNECNNLLLNPIICKSCAFKYCGKCYEALKECKYCKKDDILIPSYGNFISKDYLIGCPSESQKCKQLSLLTNLEDHINKCSYIEMLSCPGCLYYDVRPQVERHINKCNQIFEKCEFCNNNVRRFELEEHKARCDYRLIKCEHCGDSYTYIMSNHSDLTCIYSSFNTFKGNFMKGLQGELNKFSKELHEKDEKIKTLTAEVSNLKRSIDLLGKKRYKPKLCFNVEKIANNVEEKEEQKNLEFKEPKVLKEILNEIYCIIKLQTTKNEFLIVTGGSDGVVRVWDFKQGELLTRITGHDGCINTIIQIMKEKSNINLLSCGSDGKIIQYDVELGQQVKTIVVSGDNIYSIIDLSNDCIAWGGEENIVYIKNLYKETERKKLKGHDDIIYSVVKINDNNGNECIASGSKDKSIKVWNPCEAKTLRTLNGHGETVYHLAVINKPRLLNLMSSSFDKTTRLWDINTGECLGIFSGHSDHVYNSIDVPLSRMIVTCSHDCNVKIWNRKDRRCLKTLNSNIELKCAAVSLKKGFFIIAAGYEKIFVWENK